MTEKKFIAFVDILGFKDLVKNNSHQRLVELYEKLFTPNVATGLARGKFKIIDKGEKKYWEPDYAKININSLIISDSIILWTDNNSMTSFIDITTSLRTLLNHSFVLGFPLRGALVEGDLTILKGTFNSGKDNTFNTLIGNGLVEAYKLEGEQNWSGCVIEDKCIELYNNYVRQFFETNSDLANLDYLIEKKILLKYKVPFKAGIIKEHYVIDWVNLGNKSILTDDLNVRNRFAEFKKNIDDWRVENIIENTLKFINSLK